MKSPASLRSDRVATFPGLGGRFHRNTQVQLDSADVDVTAAEWHTIRIDHDGDQITGFLDEDPMN